MIESMSLVRPTTKLQIPMRGGAISAEAIAAEVWSGCERVCSFARGMCLIKLLSNVIDLNVFGSREVR